MIENMSGRAACYDPEDHALRIDTTVKIPAVLAELPHWARGYRESAVSPEELAQADLGPFVETALTVAATMYNATGSVQDSGHLDRVIQDATQRAIAAADGVARSAATAAEAARTGVGESTDRARRDLIAASDRVQVELKKAMKHTEEQVLAELGKLIGHDGEPVLGGRLEKVFAEVTKTMHETATRYAGQLYDKAVRDLDPHDPQSPVGVLTGKLEAAQKAATATAAEKSAELAHKVEELTRTVQAATAASTATRVTAAVTPIKGSTYADALHRHLDVIAAELGDDYTDTSSSTGLLPRCRKGDGLLAVLTGGTDDGHPPRIVIEMTDSVRRDWPEYLDTAERNRDAVVALGLVRTVEQVPGGRALRTYGSRRMVIAFDPETDDPALLRAAVQLLRAQAVVASSRSGAEHVDTAVDKLREASALLDTLSGVQKQAISIRKGADKIDLDCGGLQNTLARLLNEALDALAGAEDHDLPDQAA